MIEVILAATGTTTVSGGQVTAAIITAAAVAAVGIGNLVYSVFNGRSDRTDRADQAAADREQALTLAREEREHQRDLATGEADHRLRVLREERLFDHRRDAYLETLRRLAEMEDWAIKTYPLFAEAGHDHRPPIAPPSTDLGPPTVIFGSQEVWDAVQAFRRQFGEFGAVAHELDAYIAQRASDQELEARKKLNRMRARLSESVLAIAETMRDELRGPLRGGPKPDAE